MERGGTAALACTFRSSSSSSSSSPVSHCSPLIRSRGRPPAAAGAPHLLLPTGRRFSYCSQKGFLDTSKGLKWYSLTTFSPFGHPGVSLNDADLIKDKMLIDCGEEQDCVLEIICTSEEGYNTIMADIASLSGGILKWKFDGIVALGKFDALHIGHRELAMHASKSGNPFLLSFVGMAEVLGWEYRPPIVAHCDRKRVLSSWAPYCRNVVPLEYQVEFSKVRYLTPRQFVEKLSTDLRIKGVVAGENYRFGYKASGDAAELVKLCEEFGLSASIVRSVMDTAKGSYNGATPAVNSSDKGQVSSSRVRQALSVGDIEYVSKLLGRKHRLVLTASECSIKERKNIIVPKSCMINMPPADGFYENCELFNGGYLGLCRVVINTETIDIEMKDESSLSADPFQEVEQLGIEFG